MRDGIIYQFPKFNVCTVEIWEWISNFTPHFTCNSLLSLGLKLIHVAKRVQDQLSLSTTENNEKKWISIWWRHQMEKFSALLTICAGNSPVPGEFPAQRPVTRCFHVFIDLHLNKPLSKQSWGWWFETLSPHYDVIVIIRQSGSSASQPPIRLSLIMFLHEMSILPEQPLLLLCTLK